MRCPVCNAKIENGIWKEVVESLRLANELMSKYESAHPHEIAFVQARLIAALQISGEKTL